MKLSNRFVRRVEGLRNLEVDSSTSIRLALQQKAFAVMSTDPIVGVGLGNFGTTEIGDEVSRYMSPKDARAFAGKETHNSYLQMLAEAGILGGLPILLIVGIALFAALLLISQRSSSRSHMDLAIAASIVSLAAYLWTRGGLLSTLTWLLLGLCYGSVHAWRTQFPPRNHDLRDPASLSSIAE